MTNYKLNSLDSGLTIKVRKTQKKNFYEARIIFRLGDTQAISIKRVEAYSLGEARKMFREIFKDSLEAFSFDYSELNLIDDRHHIYGSGKQQYWNELMTKGLHEDTKSNQTNINKLDKKLKEEEAKRMKKIQGGG
tara:strand:+ start:465 stop:869 length:405 start_codon:yes stop_codon:yes gene_type:complete